jgi:hypothetical protein
MAYFQIPSAGSKVSQLTKGHTLGIKDIRERRRNWLDICVFETLAKFNSFSAISFLNK